MGIHPTQERSGIIAFKCLRNLLKKQFKYANDRNVRWVLVLGESELASGQVMVKDMQEGAQEAMTVEEAVQKIQSLRTS